MSTPTDRIKELQSQIDIEQRKINNCTHSYGESYYDPESHNEPYGFRLDVHGSDIWSVPEGYHEVKKPRWARKCIHCGKIEYTYKQSPKVVGYEPDFN